MNRDTYGWEMVVKSDFLKGAEAIVTSRVGHELIHLKDKFHGRAYAELDTALSELAAYRWEMSRSDTPASYRAGRKKLLEKYLRDCKAVNDPRAASLCR